MKKLRLPSLILAFVMVAALMVPGLTVLTFAADVANALTNLPSATTPEWTGHAYYNGANVNGVDYDLFQADPVYAGKTYTLSDNLLTQDVAVTRSAEVGEPSAISTNLTGAKAGSNVVGLMLKVKLTNASGSNNAFDFGFKANGVYYSTANTLYGRANANGKNTEEVGTYSVVYISDSANFNNQWKYYFAYDASHATTRLPGGFDGYIFIPASAMVQMKNQSNITDYGRQQGVMGQRFSAMDNFIAGGITEIGVNAYWGNGTYTLTEMNYVYVDSVATTTLPEASNLAWSFGWHDSDGDGVDDTFANASWSDEVRYVDATEANSNKLTAGSAFTVGEAWTTTDSLVYTAPASPTVSGKRIAGIIMDFNTAGVGAVDGPNNGINATLSLDGKDYISNKGETEQGAMYIVDGNSNAWYTVTNKYLSYVQANAVRENWTRVPSNFNGKLYIPLDALYNSGIGATVANVKAASAITLTMAAGYNLSGKLPFSNVAFVYVDAEEMNRPTALPEKENVTWTNYLGQTWAESPFTGSFYEMDESYWGKNVTYTTFSKEEFGPASETTQTWTVDANAFAGKDIADLAGILVRVSAVNSSGGYRGFNLITSDGKTFASRNNMGVPSYYRWTGTDDWTVEITNDGARVPQGESFIFVPINAFSGGLNESSSYDKNLVEYAKGLAPYTQSTDANGVTGYKDAGNQPVDKDGYLVTEFGGETKKTYSIGYGATLLADYIREMSVNGTSFTKITSSVSAWSAVNVGGIDLVWIDGISEVDTKPTTFPVNEETYRYDHFRQFNYAPNPGSYGTATLNGHPEYFLNLINSAWHPFTDYGTIADHAAYTAARALSSEFEGKAIVYKSLVSNETLINNANTVVAAGDNISYNKYGVQSAGGAGKSVTLNIPALPQGTNTYDYYYGSAGIMLKLDVNGADAGGTGFGYRITVGGTEYYTLNFGSDDANYNVSYVQSASTGSNDWMSDGKASKNRVWGSLDAYVFVPYTNFLDADKNVLTNETVYENGITSIKVTDEWGGQGFTLEYVDLCYAADDSALISAAPVLGEDIALKVKAQFFNPINAAVTLTVAQDNREPVVLTPDSEGIFLYQDIKAQNMTDNIQLTLKVGDRVVDTVENYSIQAYANNVLNAAGTSDATKTLINAMLQYGAAAQIAANYKTENLAAAQKDFSTVTPTTENETTGETVKVSASLNQEINLTVSGLEGTVVATITDAEGNVRTLSTLAPVDGTVKLLGIGANELDNVITLTVDEVVVKTLSVNNYLVAVAANDENTTANINLAKALYEYGVAAAAYAPASYAV